MIIECYEDERDEQSFFASFGFFWKIEERKRRGDQHNKKLQIKFGEASQKKQIHVSCVPWYDVLRS